MGVTKVSESQISESATPCEVCRIKTGTYTGDGTEGQGITGIGFSPKAVWIHANPVDVGEGVTFNTFRKWDLTWGDFCVAEVAGGIQAFDNRINSLDADGFTVDDDGGNSAPNANLTVYHYIALGVT